MSMPATLYEHDVYAWANDQVGLPRARRFSAASIASIAEEIETLARGGKPELTGWLTNFLLWETQLDRRGRHLLLMIWEQRLRLARVFRDNPGLSPLLDDVMEDAYGDTLSIAAHEADSDAKDFPAASPWAFEWALNGGPNPNQNSWAGTTLTVMTATSQKVEPKGIGLLSAPAAQFCALFLLIKGAYFVVQMNMSADGSVLEMCNDIFVIVVFSALHLGFRSYCLSAPGNGP